jgi:hypothetical protein
LKNIFVTSLLFSLFSLQAFGGNCVLTTTRIACPGQEKESYAKCNGQQTCSSTAAANSLEACADLALKACENQRFTVTKYKQVSAQFDGHQFANVDFCEKDNGSYVVAKNFPFRNSPDCK